MNLNDKVALVTGAASGIGRATAIAYASAGASVVVSDVDAAGGEETVQMITDAGGTATFIACDVTSEDSVASLIAGVEEQYGGLDMAYNNAGIVAKFEHVHKKPVEDFDRVIAVNVRGVFLCMKYEIPLMLKNGGGAIVNTSSTAGLVGVPGIVDYAASKHAVVGMTKTAAIEYAKQGIRINCIHPAGVNTPMIAGMNVSEDIAPLLNADTPMGRLGEPQEIADAVVWLSSDEASFITGTSLPIDAGSTAV